MAVETRRGSGFRKVGGLYLVCDGIGFGCDRIPLAIVPCSTCGSEPRFSRGMAQINPAELWGDHQLISKIGVDVKVTLCKEKGAKGCSVCRPGEKAYLMWVGSEYTAESFRLEAAAMGISKRIHALPKSFVMGEDLVFLAKKNLMPPDEQQWLGDEVYYEKRGGSPAVFMAFRPTRLEKIMPDTATERELDKLKADGITPVLVPHDDPDHRGKAL